MAWKRLATEFATFLREHRGLAVRTIREHLRQLGRWIRWLRRRGVRGPLALRPDHIDAYLTGQRRHFSLWSLEHVAGTLRGFLRFLRFQGILRRDLSALIVLPRAYALAHVPRFLDVEQVRRLLGKVDRSTPVGLRDLAMVHLMLGLGLRRGEVAALRWGDLDLLGERLRVPAAKACRPRWIALTGFERRALDAYLKVRPSRGPEDALFLRLVGARPLEPISENQISRRVTGYLRAAGIEHGGCHLLRHTFAQRMVDGGAPLKAVQDLLGHGSSLSTQIYTKVNLKDLREVAENDSLHF